jgi:hypothetical protein
MNEPVAWRIKNKNGEWLYYDEELVGTEALYAHPVKELTDEEILREAYLILMREQQRKAQEK